ncbi:hypothetical protein WR25_09888 [Diploscapter pachys]|uniref:Decapping nuclease n=1 Tax=Diploscapter pachys TaxID=2018661 RepID=A0A2A2JBT2_9BILA|nr:hypothetical protein WR25_09888 [Diploscapter pachys]
MTETTIPHNPNAYASTRPPHFTVRTSIAEYSMDRQRNMHLGRMHAKYLYEPAFRLKDVNFDLNRGHGTFEDKENENEGITVMLEWINANYPNGGSLRKALHETEFFCWRGLLTKIATTPYATKDAWASRAVRRKGVIFLCQFETEAERQRKENMSARDKLMTYWGYSFESYMTIDEPGTEPSTSSVVSRREEFATVCRGDLTAPDGSRLRLLYSAEIDAIDHAGGLVEMKTQRGELEGGFWRWKAPKWWMQSFLVGIKQIVVGHRNDNGYVRKLSCVNLDDLKASKQAQWRPEVMLALLSKVLHTIRINLLKEDDACIVEFQPDMKNLNSN